MIDQKIIDRILSKRPKLNRETILKELELEKQKTGNLIGEETLLRMIGARYGIKSLPKINFDEKLVISDLIPGLYNISIKGRIVAVFPIKEFQGEHPGKLARLIISDKDALLPVILWNEKTQFLESNNIKPGQLILFSNGYTRKDSNGNVELNMGKKSKLEIIYKNTPIWEIYPPFEKFAYKIKEINAKLVKVNLVGTVKKVFPISNFVKSNSSQGSLLRFILFDETGEIPVVVWNEQTENLKNIIKKNTKLKMINVKVNHTLAQSLELCVTYSSYVDIFSEKND
jgi:ssDNA-binding replication factor A large subunit